MNIGCRKEFEEALSLAVSSLHPLIAIHSYEENRVVESVERVAEVIGADIIYWSCTRGVHLSRVGTLLKQGKTDRRFMPPDGQLGDILAAVETLERKLEKDGEHKKTLLVLLDPDPYLAERYNNPVYRRRLRDFASQSRLENKNGVIILVTPDGERPTDLEKEILNLVFPLPTKAEIEEWLDDILDRLRQSQAIKIEAADVDELKESIVQAASGLTMYEVRYAISDALIRDRVLTRSDVREIYRLKQDTVKKSGILEYVDTSNWSMSDVGGLDNLKAWLHKRELALSDKARAFGIAAPKGVLLAGVPGCGKSLAAKCTASAWSLPLVKLDMGRVYASLVGASEQHIRHAISICEAVAPCVLWIDEIEKGLPRNRGNIGDSGVSLRVLATFLTWLQEKTAAVFVIATANEISLLPPEILRKGRFDEIFFIDLPTAEEREAIFAIHIRRSGHNPEAFDLKALSRLTGSENGEFEGTFSGAEIEAVVREALLQAYFEAMQANQEPVLRQEHFENAIACTQPLSATRAEELVGLRQWSEGRAVPATLPDRPAHGPATVEDSVRDIMEEGRKRRV